MQEMQRLFVGREKPDVARYGGNVDPETTVYLPGFVEDHGNYSVTYESHRFWIHFESGHCGALIICSHGSGWEVWRASSMLADALKRYGDDAKGLFKMCYALVRASSDNRAAGAGDERAALQCAFVDGRLRKRKHPGRDSYRVWVEPVRATS